MIDTNLRRLKRTDNGFTLFTETQRSGLVSLCDHCGSQATCKTAKYAKRSKAQMLISECPDYQTPIFFKSLKGLDQESFNTFRLGAAWGNRVSEGMTVALVGPDGCKMTEVLVSSSTVVDKAEAFKRYARDNHLMLGLGHSKEKAASELERIMRYLYGNMFVNNAKEITVIYLTPK